MGGHLGIARADIFVAGSTRWHAVTPLAASVTCSKTQLMPARLAASVCTLGFAV